MADLRSRTRAMPGFESLAGIPMRLRARHDRLAQPLLPAARRPQRRRPAHRAGHGRHRHDRHPAATRDPRRAGRPSQLQTALESRIAIEQAKGILAEHMAISVDDAFKLLRNHTAREQQPSSPTPPGASSAVSCSRRDRPAAAPPRTEPRRSNEGTPCQVSRSSPRRASTSRTARASTCARCSASTSSTPRTNIAGLGGRGGQRRRRELAPAQSRRDRGLRRQHPLRQPRRVHLVHRVLPARRVPGRRDLLRGARARRITPTRSTTRTTRTRVTTTRSSSQHSRDVFAD